MDPHLSFASRDELWHLQNDMKSVYTTQAEHSDRLLRLERRLDDDNRMKSVWGASSPFPSVLGGTPQQDPGYNPAAEAFKSFDQEQNSNLLGSLHIDTDDEPRRGASRANSVRFDETALQGHFGHTSRSSSEFFPVRTGSGLGSLPMVERSSSHKSEGRQSSTGHSAHSTRLNSLAFDPRSPALDNPGSIGPPPGLLLLGPLPSIIRCWLDENFSNDALLYAAVCTGSCTSMISSRLAHRFGIVKQRSDRERGKVTLQVYLPEATVQHASSRPLNLIPQVPSISIDFEVFDLSDDVNALQVIIGSDILRSKSAELSFSQDKMMIFDDERNKLAIPLVRPENSSSFQTLRTTPTSTLQISLEHPSQGISGFSSLDSTTKTLEQSEARSGPLSATKSHPGEQDNNMSASEKATRSSLPSTTESGRIVTRDGLVSSDSPGIQHHDDNQTKEPSNGASLGTPAKEGQTGMWGSWRRDANQPIPSDSTFSSVASGSSYQRPGRGKGMKVLKPARSGTSRSVSTTPNSSNPEQMLPRSQDPPIRTVNSTAVESPESKTPDSPQRSFSGEPRASFSSVSGGKPRTANPVGGASAFGWLNSAQK